MAAIGTDYASIDGNNPPNWSEAKSKGGIAFTIPRAVYGRPVSGSNGQIFIDPVWTRDSAAIRAAGLPLTGYLFVCYPQRDIDTPPPEEQVAAYVQTVKLQPFIDFAPAFDVEEASNLLTADQMFDWTHRIWNALRLHYGAIPIMYSSRRVWSENLNNHAAGPLIESALWIAKPWPWEIRTPAHLDGAPNYNPQTIPPWGDQWFFYQYQGDAIQCPGFTSTVDLNRFRTCKEGAVGDHVKWIQRRLGITADGIFGPQTKNAVVSFQGWHSLQTDGIVGLRTFAALCWTCPVLTE